MILDTGPLVAALDRDDQDHERCAELLATARGPLRVPGPVLTEVCYLLERERGSAAEATFLRALAGWSPPTPTFHSARWTPPCSRWQRG